MLLLPAHRPAPARILCKDYTFMLPQAEHEMRPSLAFSLLVVVPALLVMLFGCGGGPSRTGNNPPSGGPPAVVLSAFVSGLAAPVGMEVSNDGSGRLFVLEQGGRIRIIQNGALVGAPFLDITSKVESGGEKGLLGLAFHPSFSSNRRFFVYYTRRLSLQLQSVFSEYAASSSNPNQADASSERILLVVNQPFNNHNGGQLAFGPDGFLHIGLGDGGSEGDPHGNGQNLQTLLGKILRIDVDGAFAPGKQYTIPADNPFTPPRGLPEIWAYGLRNPWRFSFDRMTGTLFAGDVGQDRFEEVDIITKAGNFGWNKMEASHCYPPGNSCSTAGLILPIMEYAHNASGGEAIIGGFVYRGSAIAGLAGDYIFGDLSSGHIWAGVQDSRGNWSQTLVLNHNLTVSSFGQDATGELYLLDYGNGAVLRIAPSA
jgi:glucose/arabinose dehydrogenase